MNHHQNVHGILYESPECTWDTGSLSNKFVHGTQDDWQISQINVENWKLSP